MPTTPKLGLRYPQLSDPVNIPQDLENLATDVETKLENSSEQVVALGNRSSDYNLALNGDKNVLLTATLTGNWTLSVTGADLGSVITLELTQDGVGGRIVTLPSGTDPLGSFVLDSAAGATSIITLYTPDGVSWRRFKAGAGSLALGYSGTAATAGNDPRLRVRNMPPQAWGGLITSTFGPIEWSTTSAAGTFSADNLILTKVWLPSPQTITNIVGYIKTAGATLTTGHNFCSLWDASGNRIGATADQSTPWQTGGLKTMALTSPVNWTGGASAYLYIGFQWAGTTFPQIMVRAMNGDPTWANLNCSASAPMVTGFSGQTGLPASVTLASGSLQSAYPWFALS